VRKTLLVLLETTAIERREMYGLRGHQSEHAQARGGRKMISRVRIFPGIRLLTYPGSVTLLLFGRVSWTLHYNRESLGLSILCVRDAWRLAR
jgi:hypothetical protein